MGSVGVIAFCGGVERGRVDDAERDTVIGKQAASGA